MRPQLQKKTALHWGVACGLLMFSFVTLSGIAFRVEPFVIAQRALCSAALTGLVALFAIRATGFALMQKRNTWQR
jgi:hypothetical protein